MFCLEPITDANLHVYEKYESLFECDLSRFQSRIRPSSRADYLCWYHIKCGEEYIGAIWLEREEKDDFAVLGIFIAEKAFRNRGIGTKAIEQIIESDFKNMGCNKVVLRVRTENGRAVACYKKVGFTETRRYSKNGLDVTEMILER